MVKSGTPGIAISPSSAVAAGDDAGDRCNDGGVALAGTGRRAIGRRGIEIRPGLVERGATHEFLGNQAFRPLEIDFGVGILRLGRPAPPRLLRGHRCASAHRLSLRTFQRRPSPPAPDQLPGRPTVACWTASTKDSAGKVRSTACGWTTTTGNGSTAKAAVDAKNRPRTKGRRMFALINIRIS